MDDKSIEDPTQKALKAVFRILADETFQQRISDLNTCREAMEEQGIDGKDEYTRTRLKDIADRVKYLRRSEEKRILEMNATQQDVNGNKRLGENVEDSVTDVLMSFFNQIQWSFLISITMSIVLFGVGLLFTWQAFERLRAGSESISTFTIAGLGVSDFVIIFFTRPWKDVSQNLVNSQRARMIAITYLSGLALLGDKEASRFRSLIDLTERSLEFMDAQSKEAHKELNADKK